MLDDILKILKFGLLGAITAVVCSLAVTTTGVVEQLPDQLDRQAQMTRDMINSRIASAADLVAYTVQSEGESIRGSAISEVRAGRLALTSEVMGARIDVNDNLRAGLTIAHFHASQLEERIDDTNRILAAVALPVRNVAEQVDAAAPDFLDCDHNPNCLFNRYVGIARGVEQSSLAIGKALPLLTTEAEQTGLHIDRIAGSVDLFVQKVTKPQPLWKTVLGVARDAGTAGRLFLP